MSGADIKYQIGDWCLYDFKLVQITTMEYNVVRTVNDGFFDMGASNLQVYPLTLENKIVSETFEKLYNELCSVNRNLNFPILHIYFVDKWSECILNKSKCESVYDELRKFIEKTKEIIENAQVNGIKIIRN